MRRATRSMNCRRAIRRLLPQSFIPSSAFTNQPNPQSCKALHQQGIRRKRMRSHSTFYLCAVSVILAGCGTKPIQPSDKHIQQPAGPLSAATGIPQTIKRSVVLPPPKPATKMETYSVVVTNVPAQEILFALARDAKINLDIHPGIQGTVTLNALNQNLPQILTR